jgi:hypothetical protein
MITARSLAGSKITGRRRAPGRSVGAFDFAAAWALLGVGVLWPRKRFLAAFILTAWAAGVLVSRLFLGMHWPVDLLASIGLAFILTRPSVVAINRYLPPPGDNIL